MPAKDTACVFAAGTVFGCFCSLATYVTMQSDAASRGVDRILPELKDALDHQSAPGASHARAVSISSLSPESGSAGSSLTTTTLTSSTGTDTARRSTDGSQGSQKESEVNSPATTPSDSTAVAISGSPFRVADDVPPKEEFAPVYIEKELLARKDFRINTLQSVQDLTTNDPDKAVFYLICCGPIERVLALPERTPERPYLCYDCDVILGFDDVSAYRGCMKEGKCDKVRQLLLRRDIMFSSVDKRNWNMADDNCLFMPGVTHMHPDPDTRKLKMWRVPPHDPPQYFCTFQGLWNVGRGGTSFVRLNLAAMMNASKKQPKAMKDPKGNPLPLPTEIYKPPEGVIINIAGIESNFKNRQPYYKLFDSVYSLVMHGHGRWSYRISVFQR
eukprot:gb/GFBE01004741.1/.p1 GENE.gb/GFBE01004741.1/~~gb/GFBE01004741.1/.p1  ORF type:complete len:387 (+),score=69.83 gb/GFBE01004741.1/:1-1161(+)